MMRINKSFVAILVATLAILLSASPCMGHDEHQYRKAVASAETETRAYLRQLVDGKPTMAPTTHPKPPPKKKKKDGDHKKKATGGGTTTRKYSGGGSHTSGGSGSSGSSGGGGSGGSSGSSGGGSDSIFSPADASDRSVNLPPGAMGHGESKSILGVLSAAIGVGFLVAGAAFMRQRDFVDRELAPNHNHRLKGIVKQRMIVFGHMVDRQGSRDSRSGRSSDSLSSSQSSNADGNSSGQKSKKGFASRMSSAAKKKLVRQLSRTKSDRQKEIEADISMDMYSVTGDDGSASLGSGMLVV